jgi:cell division protein FtsX
VTPAATLDAPGLKALVDALDRLPGVSEVESAHGWVEPIDRVRRGLRAGGLTLAAAIGLATLAAATGATATARRGGAPEVGVLRLVGVSEGRLAAPLVLQAVGLATLGSLVGLALLLLASEPGAPWTAPWLRTVLGLEPLPLLPPRWLAGLTGGGALLGLMGALAAGRP